MSKILLNFVTFGINPLATLAIYSIVINLYGANQLAELVFTIAIYNTFSILSKLTTWQYALVELSLLGKSTKIDIVFNESIVEDAFHFMACVFVFLFLYCLGAIHISFSVFVLIIFAAYFVNNGRVIALFRHNDKYVGLFIILVSSLILKIIVTIILAELSSDDLVLLLILIDILIWAPLTIVLYFKNCSSFEIKLPKFNSVYCPRRINFYMSSVATIPISQLDKVFLYYLMDDLLLSTYAVSQRGIVIFSTLVEAANVLFIKSEGIKKAKIQKLEFKFTFVIFCVQISIFMPLIFSFDVIDQIAFGNILQNYKSEVVVYYFAYISCASFFWIHTKTAQFLNQINYVKSLIYSILGYYLIIITISIMDFISIGSVFFALCIQYILIITIRLYFLNREVIND